MKSTSTRILFKQITAGALIFYLFSGISSVLNYAFYPVISRFVTVSEYGEIQFLVSMFTQFAVGFVVLNILAIVIGAEINDQRQQKRALFTLNIISGIITTLLSIAGVLFLLLQKETFGLSSSSAIIALGLSLLINVPFTIAIGRLQGTGNFALSGAVSIVGALFKLVFSLLFVVLGFGVTGAIIGIFTGTALSLVLVETAAWRRSVHRTPVTIPAKHEYTIESLRFVKNRAVVALIVMTFITLLSAADSITSRIAISAVNAGHYAAVATVAKMILAASSPLMWLALPPALQHNYAQILKYIYLTLAVGLSALAAFSIAPVFFTQIIVGVDAKQYLTFLPLASVAMVTCSVMFVVATASVCLGFLRNLLYATLFALGLYFITITLLSPLTDPITSSLFGQIICSLMFVFSLAPRIFTGKLKK
jgi:O-antigen/teichoic acid export membrane protein